MGLQKEKKIMLTGIQRNKIVLANEQVVNGKGWRSGAIVESKKLSQWFFDITKFSEDLLTGLDFGQLA